jgi:OmpR-family two-component system manganese-sensing response regulator
MPRILCVDDHQDSRDVIAALLKTADPRYEIDLAAGADSAMALIDERSYDVYVLDYMMPEMSGVELCRWIRQADRHAPIVFLSALDRPTDKLIAIEAGATEYLTKPNELFMLQEVVPKLINELRKMQ